MGNQNDEFFASTFSAAERKKIWTSSTKEFFIYEIDFKMAQNCCDRDRPRDLICIQVSKWPNDIVFLNWAILQFRRRLEIMWCHMAHKLQNSLILKDNIIGPFWSLYAYLVTWPISVTAILGHFELHVVEIIFFLLSLLLYSIRSRLVYELLNRYWIKNLFSNRCFSTKSIFMLEICEIMKIWKEM